MSDAVTVKKSVPWLYFLAMFAQMLGGLVAGGYLVFYMTERLLITALVMGAVMLVSRIVDLIIGVLAGVIIQKICLKNGQYRTWLLYGPIVVAVGTTMCFLNPAIPMMAKAVIVFVGYILYGGGMSFIQLSQNGLLAKIAGPDMGARMAIAGKIVQGQNAGTILGSAICMPLIIYFDSRGTDGYMVVQIILAIVGTVGQLPLFFLTKEFDKYDPNFKDSSQGGVKLGTMFAEVLKNGQLIILLLAEILRWGVLMTIMSAGVYYFSYVARDMNMLTVALTIQSVIAFLASLVMPAFARKLGKKSAAIISGIFTVIFLAIIAFMGAQGVVFYIIGASGFMVSQALINACGVNLFLDCGEYQLYKTGKDNRTFTMSMFGIGIKIGFIISSVVVTAMLELSGYDGATSTVADIPKMVMLLGGIPALMIVAYILLMLIYGITEEKSKQYAEHNFKAAQGAA